MARGDATKRNTSMIKDSPNVIGSINSRRKSGVKVGAPAKIAIESMRTKIASSSYSTYGGVMGATGTSVGAGGNFYSPELSTDFLELPQSLDEKRNFYRFFYQNDPFVGQAIDIHTEIPLSKVRLGNPKAKDLELAKKAKEFCEKWVKRVNYMQCLLQIVHEYHKIGEVFIWMEDDSPDEPENLRYEIEHVIGEDGEEKTIKTERKDANEKCYDWLRKNYKGWSRITILPPEQIHMEAFPFTDEKLIELIIDAKTRDIINKSNQGDERAQRLVSSMPKEIIEAASAGNNIPLNTDPDAGSCIYYLARKRSPYEPRGTSMLQRVMRDLVHRDKLRQAQASIASRHMTPIRIVTAVDADSADIDELRDQVDLALMDPDYSIVTNYEIQWNEMGSDQRLLELSSEFENIDRRMYAGLGVTESLLSGESAYAGDRINLEVLNTRYMLLREMLQEFSEEVVFKPMCKRMGFIELDDYGEQVVIVPNLTFTRMALRDNNDTFDSLFNLYQKGSLDSDTIYDLLNLDGAIIREKLKKDLFTINDANFNEVLRALYGRAGDGLSESSDALEKIAENLGLTYKKASTEEPRF
jgi:hypothetical protein